MLGILLSWVISAWGICCVLVAGKRILHHKAGRTRTSFRALRAQGGAMLMPFILTGILRDCYTVLWALALIVPGIIYSLRTSFYAVATVCEGKPYQEALRRSKAAMQGRSGMVILTILSLNILLFLPIVMIDQTAVQLIPAEDLIPSILISIFTAGLRSIAVLLSLLSLVFFYAFLRTEHGPKEIKPEIEID
jgi:hypothetical protein